MYFRMFEVVNNKLIKFVESVRTMVNMEQVRVYKFRNGSKSSRMVRCESHLDHTVILHIFLFDYSTCIIIMIVL